jgi:hypothetical protein
METQPTIKAECQICDWQVKLETTLAQALLDTEYMQDTALSHEVEFDHHVAIEIKGE